MILELSRQEYEQLVVDIEQAIEELNELSRRVDWFTTEMSDRLTDWLSLLRNLKEKHDVNR